MNRLIERRGHSIGAQRPCSIERIARPVQARVQAEIAQPFVELATDVEQRLALPSVSALDDALRDSKNSGKPIDGGGTFGPSIVIRPEAEQAIRQYASRDALISNTG